MDGPPTALTKGKTTAGGRESPGDFPDALTEDKTTAGGRESQVTSQLCWLEPETPTLRRKYPVFQSENFRSIRLIKG